MSRRSTARGHKAKPRTVLTLVGAGLLVTAVTVTAANMASAGQTAGPPPQSARPFHAQGVDPSATGADHAVFVQGNELDGNTIHAFERADDGTLTAAGTYPTGGKGGDQVDAPTDSLASQGSLVYDDASGTLLAVNAGSDTVTSFKVRGRTLMDPHVTHSGGKFPASIAVSGNIAYVMNAGGEGSVQGFEITGAGLTPLEGTHRSLGLENEDVPLFSSSPGEVEFTPDGAALVVTTKSANTLEVFPMNDDGTPAVQEPVVSKSAGGVPFAVTFDEDGRMLVAEAEKSTVSVYEVAEDGTVEPVQTPLANGQDTLCWLERAGDFFFGGSTGSSTLSGYTRDEHGELVLTSENGLAAEPSENSRGVIDIAVTRDAEFVYVQNATSGTVDGFRVGEDGLLTKVTTADGLPAFGESGMEGIAAV
ncbi:lactonase family protein [Streptomyces sp. NBC_00637]|uniref:lactonase family protein n=1 Tax=Streptomyces sp. NBC_00637 TaxID=2903667 RepID=UPI00324C0341